LGRALAIRESYPEAHYSLAQVLTAQGRVIDAAGHYRRALTLMPDWLPVLNELAWLLATHPDASVRDSRAAVSFAARAVALTNGRDVTALEVLAASAAAAGRFDEAVTREQAALDLMKGREAADVAAVRERLARYQERRPYLDAGGRGPVR
jgi:Tfp pilus assembly protein PilF